MVICDSFISPPAPGRGYSGHGAHPDTTTLKADNTAAGPTDAYSPKQTCGGCHFNCATGAYSADTTTWCAVAAEKKDCAVAAMSRL